MSRAGGGRALNVLGALVCAAMLGYAFYSQFALNLDPCPLCIFQRVGVAFTGLMFLLAAVQDPRGFGRKVYGVLILLGALVTSGIAARHVWIQQLPPGTVPACGATLDYLLDVFPLADVIRKVLTGSGECAAITWRLLGLSMPAWVLISACGLGALGVYGNFRSRRG